MKLRPLAFAVVVSCTTAAAQSGTLDQLSPVPAPPDLASFDGGTPTQIWQAQVRAGTTGQLEGFTLTLKGAQGATLTTRVRLGAGWNTGPAVFQASIAKPTSGVDEVFVDTASAAIPLAAGEVFVIELQGEGAGTLALGSYISPSAGPPLYAEPLFDNGPGCFSDCGWRIGFRTWVIPAVTPFCAGDGSTLACPCGNNGAAGNGCGNSAFNAGASLTTSGVPSVANDSLVLHASNLTGNVAVFFQGATSTAPTVIDDGIGCVGGPIIRLGNKPAAANASSFPQAGDPLISVRGMVPASGGTYVYQCFYRNAAAAFCPPASSNRTNGVGIAWIP